MTKRIGIDVGGTFTDFVMLDRATGEMLRHKEPSTPATPSAAVASGIAALIEQAGARPADIELIVHGTTLSLNALLQRRGVRVALVTSRGARDILELARIRMAHSYDFYAEPEMPMVTRDCVIEADARIASDGSVVAAPDTAALTDIAVRLATSGADVAVVSLVNGYANPAFEASVAAELRAHCDNLPIVTATDIWPEMREYERTMIAVMNGYIEPLMRDYYDRLETLLREQGFTAPLSITASNGGTIDLATARARPIDTILSGPAAGVIAAANCAAINNAERIVTFDMGGTSADIAVIERGTPDLTTETMIGEIPLILPVVNVSAIGAGGGSIIRVDEQGILKVGPTSAGADPGPACYGRGGTQPTITDCYLVCGFLDGARFLGGRLTLSAEKARAALAPVAAALGYADREDPEAAAASAAIRVASSMMATEVRKLLARRGSDARAFTLIPYGGAGSTHAALLADEAALPNILVPGTPATFCALGAVVANLRRDFVRSCHLRLGQDEPAPSVLQTYLDALLDNARAWSGALGERTERWRFAISADLRYPGQAFDLNIELEGNALTDADALAAALREAFAHRHQLLYGFGDATAPVELTRLVVSAIGSLSRVEAARATRRASTTVTTRRIFVGNAWATVACIDRDSLEPGHTRTGPLVIEQSDTTVLVPEGWQMRCQPSGDLLLTRSGA